MFTQVTDGQYVCNVKDRIKILNVCQMDTKSDHMVSKWPEMIKDAQEMVGFKFSCL